jgi:hypothetical protein
MGGILSFPRSVARAVCRFVPSSGRIRAALIAGGLGAVGIGAAGCQGAIGTAGGPGPGVDPRGNDPDDPGITLAPDGLPENLRHSPGVRLLTRTEYLASIDALLGVAVDPDRAPQENVIAGHGQIGLEQGVTLGELATYYELAAEAAEAAVADLDCGQADAECARDFADDLLTRAFRQRALASEIRDDYLGMLTDPEAGEDATDRLVTLVTAALSSPHFLYRRELGREPPNRAGIARLAPEEIASRLAFLVWQSGPEPALLDRAAAGELDTPAGRLTALDELLSDPRARVGLRGFVYDWMDLTRTGGIRSKDPEVLAGTTAALAALSQEGLDRLVDDVLWDGPGTFPALLGTDRFFVRGELGPLVGVEEPTDGGFEMRQVDPAERLGVLMHPTVVAAHTKESGASPFNLGKFIYEQMLCEVIGSPPPIPDFPEAEGETLREHLEAVTRNPGCATCHDRIGPPGFAFLTMDPIGRFVPTDGAGRPWDTAGTIPVGDGTLSFESAPDLVAQLADHAHTARCVARRMARFTLGRFEGADDGPLLAALEDASVASGGSAEALLRAVVSSEAFTQVRLTPAGE